MRFFLGHSVLSYYLIIGAWHGCTIGLVGILDTYLPTYYEFCTELDIVVGLS